ncbi:MAG: hypothetical protein JXM70_09965, partial [Pirellulales bacterium]|nr:hypothetical protein [Pirellulales bacterium]
MTTLLGITSVVLGGLLMGIGPWPIKLMRRFQYEHWALISGFVGIIFIPWFVTLTFCPNAFDAYRSVEPEILVKSNLWSLVWGLANVLIQICLVRVGFSLTTAIYTGFSVVIGVTMPMCVKGTGLFEDAPDLTSPAGLTVLAGVAVMLCGLL